MKFAISSVGDPILGYMTQYWPYGEGVHSLQNPYWIQKRMTRTTDKHRYMLNASLKMECARLAKCCWTC